jgi:hypothetical protein
VLPLEVLSAVNGMVSSGRLHMAYCKTAHVDCANAARSSWSALRLCLWPAAGRPVNALYCLALRSLLTCIGNLH